MKSFFIDSSAHEVCTDEARMSLPRPLSATVLICTYNRAHLLHGTLESLAAMRVSRPWDVIIVDNNSTDHTRAVVETMAATFPVPLTYLFESRQGKCQALNTGLDASKGEVIAFTDDDVRVGPTWLDAACDALAGDEAIVYCGGPVRPMWAASPPRWLDLTRGDLWGAIAILDYGGDPFIFEEQCKVPLGANMAVHRRLIARIGGFNPELGRKGRSLIGQEQAEFFSRSREAGARGRYVPAMEVQHHVPEQRLRKHYFRRWWFWKGVARAHMDALHPITELGVDLRTVPHVASVPRYMFAAAPRMLGAWLLAIMRARWTDAARQEMLLYYTTGYIRARWARRRSPLALKAPQSVPRSTATVTR